MKHLNLKTIRRVDSLDSGSVSTSEDTQEQQNDGEQKDEEDDADQGQEPEEYRNQVFQEWPNRYMV